MGKKQIPGWLEEEVADYDIPLVNPPKTILDIGASIGAFSLRAAELWPDATIQAFEPVPESAESYRANCRNSRFQFHQKALRSFSGRDSLRIGHIDQTSSFHDLWEQSDRSVEVDCLDAALIDSAEFVKLDVEGCEVEILERLNLESTKAIACEFHRAEDEAKIKEICFKQGFELYRKRMYWMNRGVLRFIRKGEPLKEPKQKIFIGFPIYGGIDPHFFCCAMKLMAEFSVNCHVRLVIGDSLISRARNLLTKQFLDSDCTHMLMIDSDLIFSNDHIKRISSHGEDVVGGFYAKKMEGVPELVCNTLEPQPAMDEKRRLTQMKYIGTGFICISRKVIEQMLDRYSEEIMYISDSDQQTVEYDFWPVGVYKYPNGYRRYLSEDWYFCQRCLDMGFKIYGDNGIILKHSGNAVYPLSYQEKTLFRRADPVSSDSASPVTRPIVPAEARL